MTGSSVVVSKKWAKQNLGFQISRVLDIRNRPVQANTHTLRHGTQVGKANPVPLQRNAVNYIFQYRPRSSLFRHTCRHGKFTGNWFNLLQPQTCTTRTLTTGVHFKAGDSAMRSNVCMSFRCQRHGK